MISQEVINKTLASMILSHSGWRGIFAVSGDEEDSTDEMSAAHSIIAAGAATAFAEYLQNLENGGRPALVLAGCDTRPSGKAIAGAVIPALLSAGCRVRYAGHIAAPEIMAWAGSLGCREENGPCGFMYISASHNPVGHNGFKFGLADGGVLPAEQTALLTEQFRKLMSDSGARLEQAIAGADPLLLQGVFDKQAAAKEEARQAYNSFCAQVAWGGKADSAINSLKNSLELRPLGVCCDFNGSARCVSIDRDFLQKLGIRFTSINDTPGAIAHRIVPEGESLEPCRRLLEDLHKRDPAYVLGYVPDCDGDRGNLVIWDDAAQKARALEAQEVFALVCIAELAQMVWDNGALPEKTAIVVNDPTSLRIDRIAASFGASVFRAEVGEANVVNLARRLRRDGYTVRILGEGSNGGSIIHPSAVRDPLHTVLALVKLLRLRPESGKPGLFSIWLKTCGREEAYRPDFNISDIIQNTPHFQSTGAYEPEAKLVITSTDHGAFKSRYQKIFLREWEERKSELRKRYGICGWQAAAYKGITEYLDIDDFGEAGSGGLKINFLDAAGAAIASLWMRGSATEAVFRIMADTEGPDIQAAGDFIQWHSRMAIEADRS